MSEPARKLSPSEAFKLARQCQAEGGLEDARKIYERLLTLVPQHGEAATMLGSLAYQRGDEHQGDAFVDKAIGIYRAQLHATPFKPAPRASLANLLLARGQAAEAEEYLAGLEMPLNPIRASLETFFERQQSGARRGLPRMIIVTIPKSASESIWNRLAEGLGLAQSHMSIGLFPDCCLVPSRVAAMAQGGVIVKEHLPPTPHNMGLLQEHGLDRVVFHVRDPRQATLSWAHFVRDDVSMRLMAPLWRKIVPPAGVLQAGLESVIDWSVEHYLPLLLRFIEEWMAIADDPNSPIRVKLLDFELFRSDSARYENEVLDFYGIERDAFDRDAVSETIHLRKGETDEWRGVFTQAQAAAAWRQIPKHMAERFGWRR